MVKYGQTRYNDKGEKITYKGVDTCAFIVMNTKASKLIESWKDTVFDTAYNGFKLGLYISNFQFIFRTRGQIELGLLVSDSDMQAVKIAEKFELEMFGEIQSNQKVIKDVENWIETNYPYYMA